MENLIFDLKCKRCGAIVSYYPDKNDDNYQKCSNCNAIIGMRTETKINGILTLDDFEVVGIRKGLSDKILDRDLSELKLIYEQAKQKNKEKILSAIDKFSLVLNRDDEKTLEFVIEKLSELFNDIIQEKHQSFFDKLNEKKDEDNIDNN